MIFAQRQALAPLESGGEGSLGASSLSRGYCPPLCCLVCYALNNRMLKERGIPELRLPCRESGIHEAKPNRRADEGGKDLDQAALRSRDESQSSVI
jgi:hypothetical protein